MENVSRLFLFKGKLQTKSPSPPKKWSPQATPHPMPWIGPSTRSGGSYQDLPNSSSPSPICRNKWLLVFVHVSKLAATIKYRNEDAQFVSSL